MIWVIFWCKVIFIQSDSPYISCGHHKDFTERKEAIEYFQMMKKIEEPDTMALRIPGIYNVKFDSIYKTKN
jgi:hypothetical protein